MGGCLPSLWHRFQRYTLSGERVDFVRWISPGSRLLFTQRVHLMGSRVHPGRMGQLAKICTGDYPGALIAKICAPPESYYPVWKCVLISTAVHLFGQGTRTPGNARRLVIQSTIRSRADPRGEASSRVGGKRGTRRSAVAASAALQVLRRMPVANKQEKHVKQDVPTNTNCTRGQKAGQNSSTGRKEPRC